MFGGENYDTTMGTQVLHYLIDVHKCYKKSSDIIFTFPRFSERAKKRDIPSPLPDYIRLFYMKDASFSVIYPGEGREEPTSYCLTEEKLEKIDFAE